MDRPWVKSGFRAAIVGPSDLPALLLQRVACIRPRDGSLLREYVLAWLEGREFATAETEVTGISVPHISPGQIASFRLAVPPRPVQETFLQERHEMRTRVAAVEREIREFVERIQEYRDALITEAVNGKLDVSGLSDAQMDEALHAAREGEQPEVLAS